MPNLKGLTLHDFPFINLFVYITRKLVIILLTIRVQEAVASVVAIIGKSTEQLS